MGKIVDGNGLIGSCVDATTNLQKRADKQGQASTAHLSTTVVELIFQIANVEKIMVAFILLAHLIAHHLQAAFQVVLGSSIEETASARST